MRKLLNNFGKWLSAVSYLTGIALLIVLIVVIMLKLVLVLFGYENQPMPWYSLNEISVVSFFGGSLLICMVCFTIGIIILSDIDELEKEAK